MCYSSVITWTHESFGNAVYFLYTNVLKKNFCNRSLESESDDFPFAIVLLRSYVNLALCQYKHKLILLPPNWLCTCSWEPKDQKKKKKHYIFFTTHFFLVAFSLNIILFYFVLTYIQWATNLNVINILWHFVVFLASLLKNKPNDIYYFLCWPPWVTIMFWQLLFLIK